MHGYSGRQRQSIRAFPEWQRGAGRNPTRPSARARSLHSRHGCMGLDSSSLAWLIWLMAASGLARLERPASGCPASTCSWLHVTLHVMLIQQLLVPGACDGCLVPGRLLSCTECTCHDAGSYPAHFYRQACFALRLHERDRKCGLADRGRQGCLPYRACVGVTEREPAPSSKIITTHCDVDALHAVSALVSDRMPLPSLSQ